MFDDERLTLIDNTYLYWRRRLGAKPRPAAAAYPPRLDVSIETLADMITVVFEGGFIMPKTLEEPGIVAAQLGHYRNYPALLFGEPD